jgi:hypothetical protein
VGLTYLLGENYETLGEPFLKFLGPPTRNLTYALLKPFPLHLVPDYPGNLTIYVSTIGPETIGNDALGFLGVGLFLCVLAVILFMRSELFGFLGWSLVATLGTVSMFFLNAVRLALKIAIDVAVQERIPSAIESQYYAKLINDCGSAILYATGIFLFFKVAFYFSRDTGVGEAQST